MVVLCLLLPDFQEVWILVIDLLMLINEAIFKLNFENANHFVVIKQAEITEQLRFWKALFQLGLHLDFSVIDELFILIFMMKWQFITPYVLSHDFMMHRLRLY